MRLLHCDPPGMHVYVGGALACQCGLKKDGAPRVLTLAESDWLKALADDPRAFPPEEGTA